MPLVLSPEPESPRLARHWMVERLDELKRSGVEDVVLLLLSELVTNVVLHARTPCEVLVRPAGEGVRVEVQDDSRRRPRPRVGGQEATTGRGLVLLDALSDDWGADDLPGGGKVVWFEVRSAEGRWPDPAVDDAQEES
ncbi:MAG TPA: ATP-binding protein [Mycobacteriales bacterium]|nr:ATP-binding protein [Mycobacteriales bacterium]